MPLGAGFLVLAEVDGSAEEVARLREAVLEALGEDALSVWAPETAAEIAALWRWRDGVSLAVQVERGGKVSEDIVVPFDRLAEAIEETLAIGARHGLAACSWGHAGDGNLHSTFMIDPGDEAERAAPRRRPRSCSTWRCGSAAASPASTASARQGRPARAAVEPGGVRAAPLDQVRVRPKGLLNPGKKR